MLRKIIRKFKNKKSENNDGVAMDTNSNNISLFIVDDHDLPDYGYCPQCGGVIYSSAWCNPCDRKALVDKFNTWSTGNKALDLFIQETQRNATSYADYYYGDKSYFEYVPYDRFTDVKSLARGGFAEVFTAKWLDGKRSASGNVKGRTKPFTVALKVINNSAKKMEQSFINELKLHYQFYQENYFILDESCPPCYGITRDPKTMNYALILEYYPKGDLRKSLLNNTSDELTWTDKLKQLRDICRSLKDIHNNGYIHRDIHSGNVLLTNNYSLFSNAVFLADFGLTQPAADSSVFTKMGTYGVIPYMAPELFHGEPHSKASDVYAIGIIMSEIALNEPAFYDRDHDVHLQLEIIDGLRPEVPPETPKCYKDLMDRCLSGNPSDRPTVEELYDLLSKWWRDTFYDSDTNEAKQFKLADKQWKPKQQPKKRHPGAVYTSRLITHVTTNISTAAHDDISSSSRLPTSREKDLEVADFNSNDVTDNLN